MPKETFTFQYQVFNHKTALHPSYQHLMEQAIKIRAMAYAPYSNFQVGAAIWLENGEIVLGNNQENAAYPSGLCAERVALFYAVANYPNVPIKAIAITANAHLKPEEKPASPCGNCRQSLAEYEQKQKSPLVVVFMGASGKVVQCNSALDLLPFAFSANNLK